MTYFAITLAIAASIIYLVAILPIKKVDSIRKSLGILGLILGLIHAGLMIYAKNLSLIELSTYQKCLPIISLFVLLTLVSWFYMEFSKFSYKLIKSFGFSI